MMIDLAALKTAASKNAEKQETALASAKRRETDDIADAKRSGMALGKDYWHARARLEERVRVSRRLAEVLAEVAS